MRGMPAAAALARERAVPLREPARRRCTTRSSATTSRGWPSTAGCSSCRCSRPRWRTRASCVADYPRHDVRAHPRRHADRGRAVARRRGELAALPNVYIKLSGQGTFIHRVDPRLIGLVAADGRSTVRLRPRMFGTNFPVESIWTDFSSLVDAWLGVLADPHDVQQTSSAGPRARIQARRGGLMARPFNRPLRRRGLAAGRPARRRGLLVEVEGSSPLDVGATMYIDRRRDRGLGHRRLRRGRGGRGRDGHARGGRPAAAAAPTASPTSWPAPSA